MSTDYTGRTRWRALTRFLRRPLLVLQVEERFICGPRIDEDGERLPGFERTEWRDAFVEDINWLEKDKR